MYPFSPTRRAWVTLGVVTAVLLISRILVTVPQLILPLMSLGTVLVAYLAGIAFGLLAAFALSIGLLALFDTSLFPSGVDPRNFGSVALLFGLGGYVGFLSQQRWYLQRSAEALRATVQRLVDERVQESAATNQELSLEVTERLRVEETLLLREVALEVLPHGVVITDVNQDDRIVYVNEGFSRLTGYSPEETIGRNCRFLQGSESAPEIIAELRRAIKERRSCVVEIQNYRKDGSTFWNSLTIAPIKNGRGECTHYVGIQIDITSFKKIEEQYRQSQKMEAIGHLASGVAHDFNNLLTVINGCSELVRYSLAPNDPNLPFVDEIFQAGQRAAGLTRQLLTFSRKSTVQPRIVEINALVADVQKLLSRLISANIRLSMQLQANLPPVKIDPGLFEQLILNLVVNASDAMPQGGDLTIETRHRSLQNRSARGIGDPPQGEYVVLRVSDTGVGMDKATQARIFEPFFTTKPAGKGTGLGLATVYGIVQSSESHISLESQPGKGTSFTISIPVCRQASDAEVDLDADGQAPSNLGLESIFLVEDEPGVRSLARHALESQGYQVVVASNGQEALERAESLDFEIDLLLTDVVMPEMGGRELSERLRLRHPNLRVLYMSGYTDDAVLQHGISQAEMHFLQKPFSMSLLTSKVRAVLDEAMHETVS
jgi:PAS domain S-box-containing protein